ncbi:methylmalonyl-CoA epimerase [candidate division WOR-3 bacterium]|jgi:methylmalonyl-CoA/ethylmalonyl-CoA epimerase|nr:methylmalonyl-CoA epimerase [candidate division WOR-3 bacterium]
MIKKIDHIGIAVENLDESIEIFKEQLGLKLIEREEVLEQMVNVAKFRVGNVDIELLEPTSQDSPIAKYIEKKGAGIHHIAYEVDDLDKSIKNLIDKGLRMIDIKPRKGAGNKKIAFIHPKSTVRILTELCEEDK